MLLKWRYGIKHLNKKNTKTLKEGCLGTIKEHVLKDIDVIYYWSLCQRELSEEERSELLTIVVDIFITIRGFSFARSFVEQFKQKQKKGVQKSMGLRKTVAN